MWVPLRPFLSNVAAEATISNVFGVAIASLLSIEKLADQEFLMLLDVTSFLMLRVWFLGLIYFKQG